MQSVAFVDSTPDAVPLSDRSFKTGYIHAVWKFKLAHAHSITTPRGAKTLCVQEQRGHIYVWMEVNPRENREEKHYFDIIGTGWEIPQDVKRQYVGTVLQLGESLVWHVYERFE